MHGIFPFSKVTTVIRFTEQFFATHADVLAAHGVIHSFILSAGDGYYLIKPMFYCSGEPLPLQAAALGRDKTKKFGALKSNPEARELVLRLQLELRDLYFDTGALSAQIGAFYGFGDTLDGANENLLN